MLNPVTERLEAGGDLTFVFSNGRGEGGGGHW